MKISYKTVYPAISRPTPGYSTNKKISYRMVFPRLRTPLSCPKVRIRYNAGPMAGRALWLCTPSSTLSFTIRIRDKVYSGHYDAQGTWINESVQND